MDEQTQYVDLGLTTYALATEVVALMGGEMGSYEWFVEPKGAIRCAVVLKGGIVLPGYRGLHEIRQDLEQALRKPTFTPRPPRPEGRTPRPPGPDRGRGDRPGGRPPDRGFRRRP